VGTVEYVDIGSLLVIAPQGFEWEPNCGRICTPFQPLGQSGREVALLKHNDGRTLNSVLAGRVELKVKSPEESPEDLVWFIEAKDKNDQTLGWGENPGFEVAQMPAWITFPSISRLDKGLFAFVFKMTNPGGFEIRVDTPRLYKLQCSGPDSVNPMSLPGDVPPTCVSNDPLTLRLNKTMGLGWYSFMVSGSLPDATPLKNTFNLVVSTPESQVIDAVFNIPGKEIRKIDAHTPTLEWTDSVPGMRTYVTLGFTLRETTTIVKAILIEFPNQFRQDLPDTNMITNENQNFPVAPANEWADADDPQRIRLFLDDTEEYTPIPPGTYRWRFPVVVPKFESFPNDVNIWHLSLCTTKLCTNYEDDDAAVVFPIAGFALNQKFPGAVTFSSYSILALPLALLCAA